MDPVQVMREISFALQIINKSSYLQGCNQESKFAAVINVANIGLTLNPAAKEAYLVPRDGKCCLDPSYIGLVKLLTDSGSVKSVLCNLVYANDFFELDQADNKKPVTHRPSLKKSERGILLGAYALATLPDDNRQAEWMDVEDLYLIRDRSESYKSYKNGKSKSCIWVSDEGEMMRKTVIKRIYKYLPRTDRMSAIDNAIEVDNQDYKATDGQIGYIESLLENSTFDVDQRKYIETEISFGITASRAGELIEQLNLNQMNRITQSGSYNQGDIKQQLAELS